MCASKEEPWEEGKLEMISNAMNVWEGSAGSEYGSPKRARLLVHLELKVVMILAMRHRHHCHPRHRIATMLRVMLAASGVDGRDTGGCRPSEANE